jgi:ABC-type branched-subunit amino acid transport system ATPase component/branched-subunit amino acid ABC-type transport system permease component
MTETLTLVALSLGPGAILGLIALGLVVLYRGTATLNIAQGAMVMLGAYLYMDLSVRAGVAALVAMLISVVSVGLVGVAIQIVVMRPLRTASPLTRLIASVGVLITIQGALQLAFGSAVVLPPPVLPQGTVKLPDGIIIGEDRLILIAIAVVLTAVLWALYRYTKFGIATEATATSPSVADALGVPYNKLAIGNWFLAGALAGLSGPLLAPITGLDLTTMTYLVVPALAAALIAGFRSFPLALIGGMVIEVSQTITTEHVTAPGADTVVALMIIVVVLAWRRRAIPTRGQVALRLPAVGAGNVRPVMLAITVVAALASVWTWLPGGWLSAALVSLLIALPMLSVVVVTGLAGQPSFAQFALAGLGALVAATLSEHYGLPFPLLAICGAVASAIAGGVLALISLRTRGESLAIVTVAASLALYAAVLTRNSVVTVHSANLFGLNVNSIDYPKRYISLVIVVLLAAGLAVAALRRSVIGRRLIAVRSNERAALALGINVARSKVVASVIGGAIAGLGGVLIAFESTSVTFSGYDVLTSINVTAWSVIGGVGYATGPLAAMVFIPGGLGSQTFNALFGDASWLPLIGGILLIATVVGNPDGVAAVVSSGAARVQNALRGVVAGSARRTAPESANPRMGLAWLEGSERARATSSSHRPERGLTLRVDSVAVAFGGVKALDDVSFEVRPGQIHGLIGANGAGKTTALDVISGFVRPDAGSVTLGDQDLTPLSPWRRARAGLGRSFQGQELFSDLDVLDNLRVAVAVRPAANVGQAYGGGRADTANEATAEAILALDLAGVLQDGVDELSYGRRQMVAIARALGASPRVLMLDEPAAGLGEQAVEEIGGLLQRLAATLGIGILLIEHDVNFVLRVSNYVTVLDFGRVIASGRPEDVRADPAVVAAYIGDGAALEGRHGS